jgi:peptidoglycan/xylan/chitin deacetylase (PgdA/CDA1 family)
VSYGLSNLLSYFSPNLLNSAMNIDNKTLLKAIFKTKGYFAKGITPSIKIFEGVEIAPFKNDASAAVSISTDFELNWAFRGKLSREECNSKGSHERNNIPFILKMLDEYQVPITWATVGHLFLHNCTRPFGGMAHVDMPRPQFNDRWDGDWYEHDPCTNYNIDPLWYAPDLVRQIVESTVIHEIGTHSFSHINFSADHSTRELIISELDACITAMRPFGLKPSSLVFPYNSMGYAFTDVLADYGITAVRHRDERVRLSYPERTEHGVYKVYESMNLRSTTYYDYLQKVKIFIEHAVKSHAAYHLWFHPSDPLQIFEKEFHRILEYISDERDKGTLWITTMKELVAYCEAREKTYLEVVKQRGELKIILKSLMDINRYGNSDISLIIPMLSVPTTILIKIDDNIMELDASKVVRRFAQNKIVVSLPAVAKELIIKL